MERPIEEHRHLAGHADVPQAIGAIARHLDVDGGVGSNLPGCLVVEPAHEEPSDELVDGGLPADILGKPGRGEDHAFTSLEKGDHA